MYYDRTLSPSTASLIEKNGELRWLYDFVKSHKDLDFLVGKNNKTEWISVYRGLSRILTINPYKNEPNKIKISAAEAYKDIAVKEGLNLYGKHDAKNTLKDELTAILNKVSKEEKFDRYYNNKKEGYFQNIFSRNFGLSGSASGNWAIIDKEVVIGYDDLDEKKREFGKIQKKYKELQREISSINANKFGANLVGKPLGNELDFLALDNRGYILLIEYKHGKNTSGIYLSPLQIGLYYDVFSEFLRRNRSAFEKTIYTMLYQKQKIGLVNANWRPPKKIKGILPVLVISEYNEKSVAMSNFNEVLDIVCKKNSDDNFLSYLQIYSFTERNHSLYSLMGNPW